MLPRYYGDYNFPFTRSLHWIGKEPFVATNIERRDILEHAINLQQSKLDRQLQAAAATKEVIKVLSDQLDLFKDKATK